MVQWLNLNPASNTINESAEAHLFPTETNKLAVEYPKRLKLKTYEMYNHRQHQPTNYKTINHAPHIQVCALLESQAWRSFSKPKKSYHHKVGAKVKYRYLSNFSQIKSMLLCTWYLVDTFGKRCPGRELQTEERSEHWTCKIYSPLAGTFIEDWWMKKECSML